MTQSNEPTRVEAATTQAATAGASPTGSGAGSGASPSRIIKRYSNRKLYDTVESRYVTLPQIAVLVRKGEDVRIIDNNSKEDLTSVTLAQILYEEERKQSRALPLAALKDLIHTSGEKIISSLRESPVGRLMPAQKAEGAVEGTEAKAPVSAAPSPASAAPPASAPASVAPPASAPADGSKDGAKEGAGAEAGGDRSKFSEILEQSRGALHEWQHRVDERVRKVLEDLTPTNPIAKLRTEVRELSLKVEELEAKLAAAGSPGAKSDASPTGPKEAAKAGQKKGSE